MSDSTVERTGAIAFMAKHPVASNLLMFILLFGGVLGMMRVKQEVFPDTTLDVVAVSVPYPGATPEDVEKGIVLAVEEKVRGLDGVKRVSSTSTEGMGTVAVTLLVGADADRVLNDIKNEVDRIQSFPEDAETATVRLMARQNQVVSLIISGDTELSTLHSIAEKARLDLMRRDDVTLIQTSGVPPLEVSVEIDRKSLESYGLTLGQVAQVIDQHAMQLPGGSVKTAGGEILVRVDDRREFGHEFEDIILRGTRNGADVRLSDIANIRDGFEDNDQAAYYNGLPAVRLTAYRVGSESPQSVSNAVQAYLLELRAELPDNVHLDLWDDDSVMLRERIALLMRNGMLGLVLVFIVLAMFLDFRLAVWVGMGIPISFMGAFFLMPMSGMSINMITLFAFIITLGMVVDDAIVVGENAFDHIERGDDPVHAAIEGAREMQVPVTFAILTTVVAFAPMLFLPGFMGKMFRMIPMVVIGVLLISWVESFFVLPHHVGHAGIFSRFLDFIGRPSNYLRRYVTRALAAFIAGPFTRALHALLRYRYITLATAIGGLMVTLSMFTLYGYPERTFFPDIEGDVVKVQARMPYGTPIAQTERLMQALESAADQAANELGGETAVDGRYTTLGQGLGGRGTDGPIGSHLVAIEIELVSSELREFTAKDFADAWSALVPPLPGVESLQFYSSLSPGGGSAIDVMISHEDLDSLQAASSEVSDLLRGYSELSDVTNGFASGKTQLDFSLRPGARSLGLTGADLARQVRSGFYGAEALRQQRGRNEVKVMVRLPESQRQSEYDLEAMRIHTPGGGDVPLGYVTNVQRNRSATEITRRDGLRVINITAEKAPGIVSVDRVRANLNDVVMPGLIEKYPGLEWSYAGEAEEQSEVFGSMALNFVIAMFVIYALLAIPFRSYLQPAVVMLAIPFGIMGAIGGHVLMGYSMSFVSMLGIIALAGVVVNDSLVLIHATNEARARGMSAYDAVHWGARRRLRPILLTSLTTFFGLAPMIVETSVQARFLIPMALSLGFGVLFATLVVMTVVPAAYLVVEDAGWFGRFLIRKERWPPPSMGSADDGGSTSEATGPGAQAAAFEGMEPAK